MKSVPTVKKSGRPRSFDRDAALDRAMLLFWEHGYEATSLAELTAAMGISPPSLYSAFGDKERLFLEAVDRYRSQGGADAQALMGGAKTAKKAMARFLTASAERLTRPEFPRGCMVVLAATSVSAEAAPVQAKLAACRAEWEREMAARIDRGIADGDVPANTDARALASFYLAVVQGMSLHAKDGATTEQLVAIGETAMAAWPRKKKD